MTEPGLVAFYDIRPGNESGLLFDTRSPHEALMMMMMMMITMTVTRTGANR